MEIDERLGEHMGLWTKQQLRAFIKENNLVTAQDAQNALKYVGPVKPNEELGAFKKSLHLDHYL